MIPFLLDNLLGSGIQMESMIDDGSVDPRHILASHANTSLLACKKAVNGSFSRLDSLDSTLPPHSGLLGSGLI